LLGEAGAAVHAYRLEDAVKLAQAEQQTAKAAEALAAVQAVEAAKAKVAANNAAIMAPPPKPKVAQSVPAASGYPVADASEPPAPSAPVRVAPALRQAVSQMAPPVMPAGPKGAVAAPAPATVSASQTAN
jgi:hypothetical protein